MSNEELDRRIAFIIEQQAQFAFDIMQLREAQAQTEQALAQTGQIVAQTSQTVSQTSEIVGQTSEIVSQTGEIVTRLAKGTLEGFKDVNAKINALVDAQIRTDENLNRTDESLRNLIALVDRYFSQGRNGH